MCTAAIYHTKNHYFGRNLDLEFSYNETVTVTPRNYEFKFREIENQKSHYAIIGMAYVVEDYPLYYDAVNEKGLGMAGLNFAGNAFYGPIQEGKDNIGSFEFIPYILSQCANLDEAKELLRKVNIAAINFNDQLPASPLHWMISDGENSMVVESVSDGLKVYDNPTGIMTNNPTFDKQIFSLNDYMILSPNQPANNFSDKLDLDLYSRGMGGMFLPGDMSSKSRFIKAVFTRMNSRSADDDASSISQFFHILGSVCQQKGLTHIEGDKYEYTIYSSCCNMEQGVYYYTTYDNGQVTGVDMHKENLDGTELVNYPLIETMQVKMMN